MAGHPEAAPGAGLDDGGQHLRGHPGVDLDEVDAGVGLAGDELDRLGRVVGLPHALPRAAGVAVEVGARAVQPRPGAAVALQPAQRAELGTAGVADRGHAPAGEGVQEERGVVERGRRVGVVGGRGERRDVRVPLDETGQHPAVGGVDHERVVGNGALAAPAHPGDPAVLGEDQGVGQCGPAVAGHERAGQDGQPAGAVGGCCAHGTVLQEGWGAAAGRVRPAAAAGQGVTAGSGRWSWVE